MMIQRCINPKVPSYRHYGGRGIKVCDRWMVFDNFYKDIGPRPSPKHSLDRINNNGNYEPGNCRWATARQQWLNSRQADGRLPGSKAHRLIKMFGTGKILAAEIEVDAATISRWTSSGVRGEHGEVPPKFHERIREAAGARGLSMKAVEECLDFAERICPTCGTLLSPKRAAKK